MKNLSITLKLVVGFGIVLILLLTSGVLSVVNINGIGQQIELYGRYTVPNAEHVRVMQVNMQAILHELMEAILAKDTQAARESLDLAGIYGKETVSALDAYKSNQRNSDRDADIERFRTIITEAAAIRGKIAEFVLSRLDANLDQAMSLFMDEYMPRLDQAIGVLNTFSTTAMERATVQRAEAEADKSSAMTMIIVFGVASFLITLIVIFLIRKSILDPVNEIVDVYGEISKGNMQAEIKYEGRDEIGKMAELIRSANKLQGGILGDVIGKFTRISQGDLQLRVELEYPGDFAVLKKTIENTVSTLNHTMLTINVAAEQVSTGADQVASGAHALASGSAEQASSVEELTVSMSKIAEQATENSSNVKAATQYVEQAGAGVNAGNEHMKQLTEAMTDIGAASNQIVNITKVIEDIAFQTNILALNAAIEAARAGNAGKGFAVVADEVRNLAGKSAEAAKQTAELIQASVDTVSKGSQITAQTARILQEVGVHAVSVTDSIAKIDQASAEQAIAIEQIKQGIAQVSAVVQTNAATAEENSATSEEMSAQAATLRQEVAKFKLDTGYEKDRLASISLLGEPSAIRPAAPKRASGIGKY